MTSSAKPRREKALAERAANRRRQRSQRHRWPPSRVCPSRLVLPLPHRMHAMASQPPPLLQDWLAYHAQPNATIPAIALHLLCQRPK
jgi:hypothetical protein